MNPDNQCPICYDTLSANVITCPNGHSYCEQHVLERVKAMVKEGNLKPFGCESNALNCFICRAKTKEADFDNFTPQFVNLMNLTLCVEIASIQEKKCGVVIPSLALNVLKGLNELCECECDEYALQLREMTRNFIISESYARAISFKKLTGKKPEPYFIPLF